MAADLKRAVVWKSLLIDGTDYCGLWRTAEGWLLKGTVVGVLKDQRPMLASYEIQGDENWITHRVEIERTIGGDVKTLSLSVESREVWRSSGQELREIRGCDDVDRGDARNQHSCNQASQPRSRQQRVDHRGLGQIPRPYRSTAVSTLHTQQCTLYHQARLWPQLRTLPVQRRFPFAR